MATATCQSNGESDGFLDPRILTDAQLRLAFDWELANGCADLSCQGLMCRVQQVYPVERQAPAGPGAAARRGQPPVPAPPRGAILLTVHSLETGGARRT